MITTYQRKKVAILEYGTIVAIQIIGFAATGSLIGEAYRAVHSGYTLNRYFIVNSLASGFMAFMMAWGFYSFAGNRVVALAIAGLLGYQDEKKISQIMKKIVLHWLRGGFEDNERDK